MNRLVRRARVAALLLFFLVAGSRIGAQQPSGQPPTPSKPTAAQEGFVPVEQLPEPNDRIPAPALVGTAYAFVWVALFGYLWSIWRRLSTVERELQAVSRRVGTGTRSS
jgi:CcmD family protein